MPMTTEFIVIQDPNIDRHFLTEIVCVVCGYFGMILVLFNYIDNEVAIIGSSLVSTVLCATMKLTLSGFACQILGAEGLHSFSK